MQTPSVTSKLSTASTQKIASQVLTLRTHIPRLPHPQSSPRSVDHTLDFTILLVDRPIIGFTLTHQSPAMREYPASSLLTFRSQEDEQFTPHVAVSYRKCYPG